jgi:hypothetical protein
MEVLVRLLSSTLVVSVMVAITSLACADRREPIAREQLVADIEAQSSGALGLQNMRKTNGFDHERDGMKLHTIEWGATLRVQASGWKAGWRDYQVLSAEPNYLAAAVEGSRVERLVNGGTVELQGKSELQKADHGWRVLRSVVTAFKVIPPPYSLSAFAELPSFLQGCHTTLALSEREFTRGKYIYVDDIGTQAFVVAGGEPTVLQFKRDLESGTEYTNGHLTVQVKIGSAQDSGREGQILRGELTVIAGPKKTTESVYGERGC